MLEANAPTPTNITYRKHPQPPSIKHHHWQLQTKLPTSDCSHDLMPRLELDRSVVLKDGSMLAYFNARDSQRIFRQSFEVLPQPTLSSVYRAPEGLLHAIDNFYHGSFHNGAWILDEHGLHNIKFSTMPDSSAQLLYCFRDGVFPLDQKSYIEARRTLSLVSGGVRGRLEEDDPYSMTHFIATCLYLICQGYPQLLTMLRRYLSETVAVALRDRPDHPWTKVWRLLAC
ncbi:hypothetical protein BJ878DRAFT_261120 [Calycina marina]|uniref:Uncharacterized protein n=1 Tax=Calycina marina TaxID=1763456 RepID=A0A9P7Z7E3_9HELO|nr:hypothetical protein BJ878DRAFT_261120 [Calycina marina]